ncbi:MAG: polysaccharide deacetylase family protein [Solirubrobacterales bacterium]
MEDAGRRERIRRRRRLRLEQERRQRAARRRGRMLVLAAIASMVTGAVVGAGAGDDEAGEPAPAAAERAGRAPLEPREGEIPTITQAQARRGVPILMYHAVSMPPAGSGFPELFVKPLRFANHVRWLYGRGYNAVTLRQVYDAWSGEGDLPVHPIVITFDDGYRGVSTDALPILDEPDWPAVLNLTLKNVRQGELSEEMVAGLLDAGWELASHTSEHRDLTEADAETLESEVAGSRSEIAELFGVEPDFFCYPAGRVDARALRAVRRAGYLGATGVKPGIAKPSEMFRLRRIRVQGSDGVAELEAKLAAAR